MGNISEDIERKENSDKILNLFYSEDVDNYLLAVELCKGTPNIFDEEWVEELVKFINCHDKDYIEQFLHHGFACLGYLQSQIPHLFRRNSLNFNPYYNSTTFTLNEIYESLNFFHDSFNTPFKGSTLYVTSTLSDYNFKNMDVGVIDKVHHRMKHLDIHNIDELHLYGTVNDFSKNITELSLQCAGSPIFENLGMFENLKTINLFNLGFSKTQSLESILNQTSDSLKDVCLYGDLPELTDFKIKKDVNIHASMRSRGSIDENGNITTDE